MPTNLFSYVGGNPGLANNEMNNTNLNNIGLNNFKIENINSSSDERNRIRINVVHKNLIQNEKEINNIIEEK